VSAHARERQGQRLGLPAAGQHERKGVCTLVSSHGGGRTEWDSAGSVDVDRIKCSLHLGVGHVCAVLGELVEALLEGGQGKPAVEAGVALLEDDEELKVLPQVGEQHPQPLEPEAGGRAAVTAVARIRSSGIGARHSWQGLRQAVEVERECECLLGVREREHALAAPVAAIEERLANLFRGCVPAGRQLGREAREVVARQARHVERLAVLSYG
jgi:hypothetical protein